MAARKPLSDAKRAAILNEVRAGQKSCRQIAKDHKVAHSTVSEIAKEAGLTDAFSREQTQKATAARAADCRAMREQLKADLLLDAQRLRERAWSAYEVVVSTPTGAETVTLRLPPLTDARAAYTAIGTAIDKSVRLEQYDTTDNDTDARSMLGALAEGIRAYARLTPEPEEGGGAE